MQGGGAEGFILDLRNNPGGLVRSGLDIARLWMDGDAAIFNVQGREDNGHIAIMQVRPSCSRPTSASCRGSCEQRCKTSTSHSNALRHIRVRNTHTCSTPRWFWQISQF